MDTTTRQDDARRDVGNDDPNNSSPPRRRTIDRRMKWFALLLGLVVMLGVGTTAAVAGGWHRGQVDPEDAHKFITWKVDDVLGDLDASDDQRTAIHEVKDTLFAQGLVFRDSSHDHRDMLIQQLLSDQPDADAMHAEVDAWIEELRTLAHDAVDGAVTVHGTLTPEQRAALIEELGDRLDRFKK